MNEATNSNLLRLSDGREAVFILGDGKEGYITLAMDEEGIKHLESGLASMRFHRKRKGSKKTELTQISIPVEAIEK